MTWRLSDFKIDHWPLKEQKKKEILFIYRDNGKRSKEKTIMKEISFLFKTYLLKRRMNEFDSFTECLRFTSFYIHKKNCCIFIEIRNGVFILKKMERL